MAVHRSIRSFEQSFARWQKGKAAEAILEAQVFVAFAALERLVLKTPVDTGRARGNWQVTQTRLSRTERQDWEERDPIAKGQERIEKMPLFQLIWIGNHVPYINALEDGHSKQARPNGMLKATLNELTLLFG